MAMLAIQVPEEMASKLRKIRVPGQKTSQDEYHITLFYFEKTPKVKEISHIMETTYNVLKNTEPFTIQGRIVTSFPRGEDGVPIIVPVDSDDLISLRKRLARKFDDESIEYSKKHPEYQPHITLAYSSKEFEDRKTDQIKCEIPEIGLWMGDDMKGGIQVTLPLKNSKRAMYALYADLFVKLARQT